jgi:adenylate kinase family enzyme
MKAIIIGNAGSGKTCLARRLADGIDTPTVHLDELFWQPGGFDAKRDQEEVDRLIEESKRTASWVVEGVFGELAERYFAEAELLIWLDIVGRPVSPASWRAALRASATWEESNRKKA